MNHIISLCEDVEAKRKSGVSLVGLQKPTPTDEQLRMYESICADMDVLGSQANHVSSSFDAELTPDRIAQHDFGKLRDCMFVKASPKADLSFTSGAFLPAPLPLQLCGAWHASQVAKLRAPPSV